MRYTDVPWDLLKQVSRSFFLTLRLLPCQVREPIAIAYLLARLSDTEADGAVSPAENELLSRREECLKLLEKSPDRDHIQNVWSTIQAGQDFDRDRFSDTEITPLTSEELDRYTYLVAGCVGEFWTTLCSEKIPNFSVRMSEEMTSLGVEYGKGLQLVNILRDRKKDAKLGRIFVPVSRFEETLQLAQQRLRSAEIYVHSIRPFRLRTATALPVLLAKPTLDLIAQNPSAENIKIRRSQVWKCLFMALGIRPVPGERPGFGARKK